mgnify:CR=1 FL=1
MRFTTSKETGNPNSNIIRRRIYARRVIIKELTEMLRQFSCYNVLIQFCFLSSFSICPTLITPEIGRSMSFKNIFFNLHVLLPLLSVNYRKCSVVILVLIVGCLSKNIEGVAIVSSWEEQNYRTMIHHLMQIIEYLV